MIATSQSRIRSRILSTSRIVKGPARHMRGEHATFKANLIRTSRTKAAAPQPCISRTGASCAALSNTGHVFGNNLCLVCYNKLALDL